MSFSLKKIRTDDADLSRVQDNVGLEISKLGNIVLLQGTLLTGVAITTSGTLVPHGLGRTPNGYIVARSSANAVVYDGSTSPQPSSLLSLKASAAVTVSLWVF